MAQRRAPVWKREILKKYGDRLPFFKTRSPNLRAEEERQVWGKADL